MPRLIWWWPDPDEKVLPMTYNEIEIMEMSRDYEEMEQQALQDAEELRQLRKGERVIVPTNIEHARTMFKISSFYLSQHDKEFALEIK